MTFSIIPDTEDKRVHAVMDWMIRSVCLDPGTVKLRAVCGTEVRPARQLPPAGAPCGKCCSGLPANAIPRPAPGSPMLLELARLHAELTR
jgi:hypothetical protein